MLPIDSFIFWPLAIIGVILTGISKSGFAGGAGVVAVPLLALMIPVPMAAALMLPLLIVMDIRTISFYRPTINNLKAITCISIAAVLGIALAGTAMAKLSADTLQLCLGVFSILFAVWGKLSSLMGRLPGTAYLWGMVSGVTSTLLHAGGPPISIYFLSQKLSKQDWLSQAAVFFFFMNVIKLIPYSLSGLYAFAAQKTGSFAFLDSILGFSLLLIPFALLGVKLGYFLQQRISQDLFIQLCKLLLLLAGVTLLVKYFV